MRKILLVLMMVLNVFLINWSFVIAEEEAQPAKVNVPAYVISEADYKGAINGDIVLINADFKIDIMHEHAINIPLFSKEVAIVKKNLPKGVLLIQSQDRYELFLPGKGSYSVQMQFTALVEQKSDRKILKIGINPASVSKLSLLFAGTDLDIQTLSSISAQIKPKGKETEFTAFLGASKSIEVSWFAKPTALAKAELLFNSENNSLINIAPGLVRTKTFLNYKIIQGRLSRFSVSLPQDVNLLTVRGENLKNWNVRKEKNKQLLDLELTKEANDSYQLVLETEEIKDKIESIYNYTVPDIVSLNTQRESGNFAVMIKDDLKIRSIYKSAGLSQLDVSDLPQQLKKEAQEENNISLAYRFLRQEKELAVTIEKIEPEINVRNNLFLEIQEETMKLIAQVDYTILKAGVFNFKLNLPVGMDVTGVSGNDIENWKAAVVKGQDNREVQELQVQLRSKAIGEYSLKVELEKPVKNILDDIVMPEINVAGANKVTGYVGVGCDSSIRLKTKQRNKLTEVGLNELIGAPQGLKTQPILAYKYLIQPYELLLAAEKVDSRVMSDELSDIEGISQVDVKELPQDKMTGIDIPVLHALQYVRYPYNIMLNIKKHEDVSVLVAVVESATINTVLGQDGQVIVSAVYQIKNRSKQYLDLILPKDAAIWSTFVDGKPVKPAKTEDGKVLLPLVKYEEKDKSFPVEIIYETKRSKMFAFGAIGVSAPAFDIPLTNVVWNIYLPYEFNYHGFGGNMQRGMQLAPQSYGEGSSSTVRLGTDLSESPAPSLAPQEEAVSRRLESAKKSKVMVESKLRSDEIGDYEADRYKGDYNAPANMVGGEKELSKDQSFFSNISSQVARYNQQVEMPKKQEVQQGRQKGVLPIHVTIPTGGRLFTFSKLISREPLKIHVFYTKKSGKMFMILMIIVIAFLISKRGSLLAIFRGNRT
ncbi:MAG: hypothetical protein HY810_04205 [Candidatus Omnitrophica bacterium]|nr:hypothetical protein [Candidatus Omnitrophota bacterium]